MATSLNAFTIEAQLLGVEHTMTSSSSSETKFIGSLYAYNTSESNVEITLWLNLSTTAGTTGSGGNEALVLTIPARKGKKITELVSQVIAPSCKLSVKASVPNVINMYVSGTTET